jgi:hypothetical protein
LLCFGGVARESGGMPRPLLDDGRLEAGRLDDLRAVGREDLEVDALLLDAADRADELGEAEANMPEDRDSEPVSDSIVADEREVLRRPADVLDRVVRLVDEAVRGLVEDEDLDGVDRDAVVRGLVVDRLVVVERLAVVERLLVPDAAGAALAVDMVLAAAVSALAAVVIALVAVFMACIADDMVFADEVALVAAAVIFVAADVTLVAAEDTVLAADAGVAELLDAVLRAEVLPADRDAVLRDAVLRDAVLRADVLRVDRDAGLRAEVVRDEVVREVVLRDGLDAVLRVVVRDDVRLADDAVVRGRLAVPDALRLADLLRPVLAELRRLAALVRFWIATDFPPS